MAWWRIDLRSKGREFDSRWVAIKWLLLGWVTICSHVNHLGI